MNRRISAEFTQKKCMRIMRHKSVSEYHLDVVVNKWDIWVANHQRFTYRVSFGIQEHSWGLSASFPDIRHGLIHLSQIICVIKCPIVARRYIDAGSCSTTLNENTQQRMRYHATKTRACHWLSSCRISTNRRRRSQCRG